MQTNNRAFDDLAALLAGAVGVAKGARDELALLVRQQGERLAGDLELASREEVAAILDLVRGALTRLDLLDTRLAEIEARLGALESTSSQPAGGLPQPTVAEAD